MRTAHLAAIKAAENAEAGHPQRDTGAAIAAAAGPDHPAIARRQAAQLAQSLAAHPDQGEYQARTSRAFDTIPRALLGITGFAVILVILGFRRFCSTGSASGARWVSRRCCPPPCP